MKIAALGERAPGETRTALTPHTTEKFCALGMTVGVEAGAGAGAGFADDAYAKAGADVGDIDATLRAAHALVVVGAPDDDIVARLDEGALVAGLLDPYRNRQRLAGWAARGVTACAMELIPRISRAQAMDALSSQASLAGYRAVIDAAGALDRAMPMMMTAAGAIAPARVFVMGAGVAGLQAVATARRMGAAVSATDVRRAAGEEVASLGARFVMVEADENEGEGEGGYARDTSDAYKARQAELVARTVKQQDIVICTALIPGRPAPVLVSAEMVASMTPGAIIVDLAASQGGNCALSQPGRTVQEHGVTIMASLNPVAAIAHDASAMYARNVFNFIAAFHDPERDALALDDADDDILSAVTLTRGGVVAHPGFAPS